MVVRKEVLRRDRVRRVPQGFGWVDHRLVRHQYVRRCESEALALYLFLVTVSDEEGLSYYSDRSLCAALSLTAEALGEARAGLIRADLIAWREPLYQVLSLDEPPRQQCDVSAGPLALGEILRVAMGGAR